MDNELKVSVIVPFYNNKNTIVKCLSSIQHQSYSNIELIAVNDGSEDGSVSLATEMAKGDDRVRIINQNNKGVSAARNRGLSVASGKYVMFCDADDYFECNSILNLVTAIEKTSSDIVSENYNYVLKDETIIKTTDYGSKEYLIGSEKEKIDYILNGILSGKYGWSIFNRIFNLRLIREHKLQFNTDCENYGEDLGFLLSYFLYAQKVFSIKNIGYNYLIHQSSITQKNLAVPKINALNEVAKDFYFRVKKNFPVIEESFAAIFFLMLNLQYKKVCDNVATLPKYIEKIEDKIFYTKMNKCFLENPKKMIKVLGIRSYLNDRNIVKYCMDRKIFNYYFRKKVLRLMGISK